MAATYLNSEFYTMVGENGTTKDGYASGVADSDGQTVEWDGTSSLTLAHELGNAVAFDG